MASSSAASGFPASTYAATHLPRRNLRRHHPQYAELKIYRPVMRTASLMNLVGLEILRDPEFVAESMVASGAYLCLDQTT